MIKRDAVGVVSPEWPPKRVMFRHADGGYDLGFDNAAEGQFVVNLTGWVDIEVGDGTMKRLGRGSILLAEDTNGRGQNSSSVAAAPRTCLFIPLASNQ